MYLPWSGPGPHHLSRQGHSLLYLVLRGNRPGPLFVFTDGTPLSCTRLVVAVRGALQSRGVEAEDFNGHSFRIGATTAAVGGLSDPELGIGGSPMLFGDISECRERLSSLSPRLVLEHSQQ